MPGCTGVNVFLTSSDGSWCEVSKHTRQVWEAGPTPLWAAVEGAHRQWRELGEPGWDRFGLTVTSDRQWVWLDVPDGHHSWPLCPPAVTPGRRRLSTIHTLCRGLGTLAGKIPT